MAMGGSLLKLSGPSAFAHSARYWSIFICPAMRSGRSEKYSVCWLTFTSRKVLLAASTLRSSALCTNMSWVFEVAAGAVWLAAVDSIAAAKRNAVSVYFTHLYVLLVVFMNHFSFCFGSAASQI